MLMLASIACAGSVESAAPAPAATQPVIQATSQPTQVAEQPAIPEYRRLTLEFPPKMRAGVEGDIVRLTLEVDDLGNIIPTAQMGGNIVVGEMVGSFKSAVTKKIRKTGLLSFQWQKSFHDRIIRDEVELYNVRNYIRNNPRNWYQDELKEAA